MSRLILLNGPPAAGKSSLARRYAAEHPLTLNLDLDLVRSLLGGWRDDWHAAGLLARELALAMAHTHLMAGHEVIVAQLVADPAYLDRLTALARELGVELREVVLLADRDELARRYADRADPASELVDGMPALDELSDRLLEVLARRPQVQVVRTDGSEAEAYRELLTVLSSTVIRAAGHSPQDG